MQEARSNRGSQCSPRVRQDPAHHCLPQALKTQECEWIKVEREGMGEASVWPLQRHGQKNSVQVRCQENLAAVVYTGSWSQAWSRRGERAAVDGNPGDRVLEIEDWEHAWKQELVTGG